MTIPIGSIAANALVSSSDINSVLSSYGTEINRIGPIVDGAAIAFSSLSLGKLVQRGAVVGEIGVGYLAVSPLVAAGTPIVQAQAPTGHTGALFLGTLNGVNQFTVLPNGNVTAIGTVTAAGFIGPNGGLTSPFYTAIGTDPTNTPLFIRAAGAQSAPVELIQTSSGVSTLRSMSASGNEVVLGTITSAGFIGPNGGLSSPFLNAIGTNAANTPLLVRGASGQTNPVELIQTATGLITLRSTDAAGNAVFAGTVSASTGFIGPLTGLASHATLADSATQAVAMTAPVPIAGLISDYKLIPNASAGVVTVSAGGAYGDSAGNHIGPLNAQNVTLPTQPTGTNIQFLAISLAPSTGAPVVTAGPASATGLPKPLYPIGNFDNGMVTWRGVTTLPSGIVAAADIVDARNFGGAGGTGAGGAAGAPSSGQYWIAGTNAAVPNALDATNPLTNGFINLSLIKDDTANPGLAAILTRYLQADLAGRITKTGTNAVTINAAAGDPATIRFNGKSRQNTAPVSATASGATGQRFLVVDVSPATGFVCTLQATNTVTANTLVVATYWWDNTAAILYDDVVDISPLGTVQGVQVAPTIKNMTDQSSGLGYVTTAAGTGSWAVIPGYPTTTVRLSVACLLDYTFTHTTSYTAGASGGMNLGVSIDGAAPTEFFNTSTGGNWRTTVTPNTPILLGPGPHTFQAFALKSVAGDTIQVYVPFTRAGLKFWHA